MAFQVLQPDLALSMVSSNSVKYDFANRCIELESERIEKHNLTKFAC